MLVFNNTIKSPLKNIEIKGNTTPCGFDNGDGTFKITILTTNGLEKSDPKYEEISQDIIIPCKLGSVNEKQDIIKFDKTRNKLILEQKTENGKLLEKPKIHELNFTLNVIGFDGKSTIKVSDGSVEAIVKATASKTLFSGQHAIADTLREIMSAISSNFNYINKVKAALDSHRHKNVTTTSDGFMSKEDKEKLNGVQINANNYIHPNDANTRHVSDAQIASWDEKPTNMDVDKKIKKVVGSAPEALDTLKEISDALNNDSDFAGTMTKQLANKSDKEHNHNDLYYTKNESDLLYFHRNMGNVTDFNLCVIDGKYSVASAVVLPNSPIAQDVYGTLLVYTRGSSGELNQIYLDYRGRIFIRWKGNGGSWKNWTKIFSTYDLPSWDDIKGKPKLYNKKEVDDNFVKTKAGYVTDFNTANTPGIWNISGTDIPNAPFGGAIYGTLETIDRNGDRIQRVTTSSGAIFIRYYAGGGANQGFREWIKVYTSTTAPKWSEIREKPSTLEGLSVGDDSITVMPHRSNEISFGGAFRGNSTIYFGYRDIDGRPAPTEYVFGKAGSGADIKAKDFYAMGNKVYHPGNKPTWNDIENKPDLDSKYFLNYRDSVTDFNNCKAPGNYYVSKTNIPNAPYDQGGFIQGILLVYKSFNNIIQIFIDSFNNINTRFYDSANSSWGIWERSAALRDFTSMFDSKSGYQKLPNGIIIQWGSTVIPFDGYRAHGYLNYPIAFKEYAHVTGNVASNDYGGFCETSGIVANDTLSRAYAEATDISNRNQHGHSVKFQWIAIGR